MLILVRRAGFLVNLHKFLLVPPRMRVYFLGSVEEVLSMRLIFVGVVARIILILHYDFLDVLVLYIYLDWFI